MFEFQRRRCTKEIFGTIISAKWNDEVWFIVAEYIVNGIRYTHKEQLTYFTTDTCKIGKIPVGMKYVPAIKNISEGAPIKIVYNPSNPKRSYFPNNNGVCII